MLSFREKINEEILALLLYDYETPNYKKFLRAIREKKYKIMPHKKEVIKLIFILALQNAVTDNLKNLIYEYKKQLPRDLLLFERKLIDVNTVATMGLFFKLSNVFLTGKNTLKYAYIKTTHIKNPKIRLKCEKITNILYTYKQIKKFKSFDYYTNYYLPNYKFITKHFMALSNFYDYFLYPTIYNTNNIKEWFIKFNIYNAHSIIDIYVFMMLYKILTRERMKLQKLPSILCEDILFNMAKINIHEKTFDEMCKATKRMRDLLLINQELI